VVGLASATGTVTLSGPAPAGGAEVFVTHTSLALGEDLLGEVVTVPAGATSATFAVDTYKVSVPMVGSIRGTFGGVTQTAVLTVNPASAPTLSALSVNPASVVGGGSSTGTVTLSAPAPSGGLVVTLSDNSAAATVPASVTVPAGATTATFTITTAAVAASTSATVSATAGGVTRSATLAVNPATAVTVSGVSLNPTSVTGGNSSQGTVTLTGPAPSGGLVVTLASGNTAVATVPASVTVPAGATSATFPVTTRAVAANTAVTITATAGGVSRQAVLTVTPRPADAVSVTRAEYKVSDKQLRVEATSTSGTATVKVYVAATNELIGTLTNDGGGRYRGQFTWPVNPQTVTVRSSLGGVASRTVTAV
jgi:trimeric autotransporter adhesin